MRTPFARHPPPMPAMSHPMAVAEVCVVAWLACGAVVSLWGMVWGGSGAVLGRFGNGLEGSFCAILVKLDPQLVCQKGMVTPLPKTYPFHAACHRKSAQRTVAEVH